MRPSIGLFYQDKPKATWAYELCCSVIKEAEIWGFWKITLYSSCTLMKQSFPMACGSSEGRPRSLRSNFLLYLGTESRTKSHAASALQFGCSSSYNFQFFYLLLAMIDFCGYFFSDASITEYNPVIYLLYRPIHRKRLYFYESLTGIEHCLLKWGEK